MRKFLYFFAVLAIAIIAGVSCEDPKPLCEQNNFCKVTIKNNTSIALWVDCTEEGDNYNAEKRIMPGSSYTYTMIPGTLTVWAASDAARQADNWNWDEIYVSQCEEFTFTWRSGKGASEGVEYNEDFKGLPKN